MINLKRITVPVFLIYAGIIHAIGIAMLMPMLITLPGPGGAIAPKPASVDIEIALVEPDSVETSALPASPQADEGTAPIVTAPGADGAGTSGEAQSEAIEDPTGEKDEAAVAVSPSEGKASAGTAKPAKKPAAQRRVKPAVHAKNQSKIAPFNGAMSGLFAPGAPAKRQ